MGNCHDQNCHDCKYLGSQTADTWIGHGDTEYWCENENVIEVPQTLEDDMMDIYPEICQGFEAIAAASKVSEVRHNCQHLQDLINHDQRWLDEVIQFEKEIRHAEIKSLCNRKSICEMREILRLVLGKLKHINDEAIAASEVKHES